MIEEAATEEPRSSCNGVRMEPGRVPVAPNSAGSKLHVASSVEPDVWDEAVCAAGGCAFHSYAWSLFTAESNATRPLYLSWRDASAKTIGIAVATEGRLRLAGLPVARTLSLGSLPAFSCEQPPEGFVQDIVYFAQTHGYATLSLHSFGTPWGAEMLAEAGVTISRRWEFLLDLSSGPEALFASMHSKKRNLIRKGQKTGVVVRRAVSGEDIGHFRNIALETYRRKQSRGIDFPPVAGEAHYRLLANRLMATGLGRLYLGFADDLPIAGAFFCGFNGKAYYLLSAASDKGLGLAAPDLVLWTAIQDFHAEGYKTFNFGGVSEGELDGGKLEESGLYHFKVRFGAQTMPCARGALTLKPGFVRAVSGLRAFKNRVQKAANRSGR